MNDMKYLVKVSQFVNKTFALWVIIFGILGFIFPEILSWSVLMFRCSSVW